MSVVRGPPPDNQDKHGRFPARSRSLSRRFASGKIKSVVSVLANFSKRCTKTCFRTFYNAPKFLLHTLCKGWVSDPLLPAHTMPWGCFRVEKPPVFHGFHSASYVRSSKRLPWLRQIHPPNPPWPYHGLRSDPTCWPTDWAGGLTGLGLQSPLSSRGVNDLASSD